MNLSAIGNIQKAKTSVINTFVKNEKLNKSLTDLVDAEAQFNTAVVRALTDLHFNVVDSFYNMQVKS
jgi:hypothetical protein